jgi:imidazolonepropionase-like amidohydrolase
VTLVMDGERIASVGGQVPVGARVVDGNGRFLIPGLWDLHAHWESAPYLALFIANGVTGVRMMFGLPHHLQWRREIEAGARVGPRMVIAGRLVDGPKPYWKGSIATHVPQDGRDAVRRTQADGYDFVKVYSGLAPEVFHAIADEARKLGIPFAGHVPSRVRAADASAAGQKSIEHLTQMLLAVSSAETELRAELERLNALAPGAERGAGLREVTERLLATHDATKAAALYAVFRVNRTWHAPTITLLDMEASPPEALEGDSRLRFMPPAVRQLWSRALQRRTPEQLALARRVFERRMAIVGEMHRAGVGILAGSDVLNPYCYPGFSLHDELQWLVKAGLSPMAALQSATRDAAVYLERTDIGTVEPGKLADLVLLDADPLQDIRNTQKIAAVITRGKVRLRDELDRMLADVERLAREN